MTQSQLLLLAAGLFSLSGLILFVTGQTPPGGVMLAAGATMMAARAAIRTSNGGEG